MPQDVIRFKPNIRSFVLIAVLFITIAYAIRVVIRQRTTLRILYYHWRGFLEEYLRPVQIQSHLAIASNNGPSKAKHWFFGLISGQGGGMHQEFQIKFQLHSKDKEKLMPGAWPSALVEN